VVHRKEIYPLKSVGESESESVHCPPKLLRVGRVKKNQMKKLSLQNVQYQDYQDGYRHWLASIGMSSSVQYCLPRVLREALHWMEQNKVTNIEDITPQILRNYFHYLSMRPNQTRGGGLSKSHINKHLYAIKKFSQYLWLMHRKHLIVTLKYQVEDDQQKISVLTHREISSLYEAAQENPQLYPRDVIILDLFYGCGLRRSEGEHLDVNDIDLTARRIHVRHGKNNTERYVPFTKSVAHRIKTYLSQCRLDLVNHPNQRAFMISQMGTRLQGQSMRLRLQRFQKNSPLASIQSKQIGLHTLRHTIATHLLYKGLTLRQVAQFLGHSSIESTQIYTHLASEIFVKEKENLVEQTNKKEG